MISRKSILILLVTIGSISATAMLYVCGQWYHPIRSKPSYDQVYPNQDKPSKNQLHRAYGKIRLPADISISLAQTENVGGPVTIIISASSLIPVGSGVITLRVPQIGAEPNGTEVLWSGAPSDFVAEIAEYTVDALPVGKYRFIAIFEFTPNRENTEILALSKSLYLDVRPTVILSSNVSFSQIERVELRRQLEERAVVSLRPGLAYAGPRKLAREIALIKARDPGIIARKIAEIKATDPEVARRIMELNRVKAKTIEGPEAAEPSQKLQPDTEGEPLRGQPAFEQAVPIPERFRGE